MAQPAAKPGSLPAEALSDLKIWLDFNTRRDRIMDALFGLQLPRSPLRDDLVRRVLVEFGDGLSRPVSYYVEKCQAIAGATAVKSEITVLANLGVLLLDPKTPNPSSYCVGPSQRLVDWYAQAMPSLRAEAERLLLSQQK